MGGGVGGLGVGRTGVGGVGGGVGGAGVGGDEGAGPGGRYGHVGPSLHPSGRWQAQSVPSAATISWWQTSASLLQIATKNISPQLP